VLLLLAAGVFAAIGQLSAQSTTAKKNSYRAPRTSWGAPDIHGDYTNKDEANTPLERPAQLAGKEAGAFGEAELAQLAKERAAQAQQIASGIGGAETGAGPTHWYDHLSAKGSRPWFVVDPPDGHLPPMTPQAQRREAAVALLNDARDGEGRADSPGDRSMYDRCITRGLPGSMMPAIYGNAYQIVQTADAIAIRYEMIHETRIIPLDGRPHARPGIRLLMGDARGRFDGDTLVVETTNFSPETNYQGSSQNMKLTERFRRVSGDVLMYEFTVDDPAFTKPWTAQIPMSPGEGAVYEYACSEGNLAMTGMLAGARADEKAASR
jgi:hypothetical protein